MITTTLEKISNKHSKMNKAFTLVEIIVVIGIMGFLTAIIYSSFDASKAQSRDQQRVSDISVIQLALEQYFNKYGVYPATIDVTNTAFVPKYLINIPNDPTTNRPYSLNYIPLSKVSDNDNACISYHLWTTFELKNQYLISKKGFNSSDDSLGEGKKYYRCGSLNQNIGINASGVEKMYDVMPQ